MFYHIFFYQVASLKKENTILSSELTDSAQKQETIQKNLIAGLEREKKMKKEFSSHNEILEISEKSKKEIQTQLAFEIQLKENKHKQLLKSVMLTHKYVITLFCTCINLESFFLFLFCSLFVYSYHMMIYLLNLEIVLLLIY